MKSNVPIVIKGHLLGLSLMTMMVLATTLLSIDSATAQSESDSNTSTSAPLGASAIDQNKGVLDSANLALGALQQADNAGVNTEQLVSRYNRALELMDESKRSELGLCDSSDDCRNKAEQEFISIAADSISLKDDTIRNQYQKTTLNEIYVVIAAIIIAFFAVYFYNLWKSHELKQFLSKEIREGHQEEESKE